MNKQTEFITSTFRHDKSMIGFIHSHCKSIRDEVVEGKLYCIYDSAKSIKILQDLLDKHKDTIRFKEHKKAWTRYKNIIEGLRDA